MYPARSTCNGVLELGHGPAPDLGGTGFDHDGLRPLHIGRDAGQREAALVPDHLAVALDDLRVDEGQRLRLFAPMQQALMLFVLVGTHQLITQWVQSLQGGGAASFAFLLPALTSALVWPLLFALLRRARRYYEVR